MNLIAMAMAFKGLANEYGSKIGKNEGLDKGHQDLDHVNKYGKGQ